MAKKDKEQEDVQVDVKDVGFTVKDPQVLRPKELPLVLEPNSGKWANEAQETYAKVLNAYAYKNPEKWAKKKEVLLKQLEGLANDPSSIGKFQGFSDGQNQKLTYKNNLLGG